MLFSLLRLIIIFMNKWVAHETDCMSDMLFKPLRAAEFTSDLKADERQMTLKKFVEGNIDVFVF